MMYASLKKTFIFGGVGDKIEILRIPKKANILNAKAHISGLGFNDNIALSKWGTTVTTSSGDGTRAIDNQSDTYWEGETSEAWIVLDFHSLATINGVVVPDGVQVADGFVWAGTTWLSFKARGRISEGFLEPPREVEIGEIFPEIATQKIMLAFKESEKVKVGEIEVHCVNYPLNPSFRIGDEAAPIWNYAGEFTLTGQERQNFTQQLQAYLDISEPDEEGNCEVPFVFHSDSPGKLDVQIAVDYNVIFDAFSDGSLEQSFTLEPFEPKTIELLLPKKVEVTAARIDLGGTFSEERVKAESGKTSDDVGAMVSTEFWVGQEIEISEDLKIAGVDIHLARISAKAELNIELQTDAEGEPSGTVITSSSITLEKTYQFSWTRVTFPHPASLIAENNYRSYWLVLKAKKGEVDWHCDSKMPDSGKLKYSKDSGITWAEHGMNALFRVRDLPEKYLTPLSMQVESVDVDLTKYEALESVDFTVDFKSELISALEKHLSDSEKDIIIGLTFTSVATGNLTVSSMRLIVETAGDYDTTPPTIRVRTVRDGNEYIAT